MFFICWAPFHAQRLVAMYGFGTDSLHVYVVTTYISGILYYLSTCINPLLYNIMSNKFREAFKVCHQPDCSSILFLLALYPPYPPIHLCWLNLEDHLGSLVLTLSHCCIYMAPRKSLITPCIYAISSHISQFSAGILFTFLLLHSRRIYCWSIFNSSDDYT